MPGQSNAARDGDDFNGSPWRFLRDFLENEIDQRKAAGFADDHDYVVMAQRAHDALLTLWSDSDKAISRAEAADKLARAIQSMTEQMRLPGVAGHTLGAFLYGAAIRDVDQAHAEHEVAAGRRALTPRQHAS